jgi:uncharacterized membrane protein
MRVSRYQRGYRFLPNVRAYLRDSILFAPLLGLALGSILASAMINLQVTIDADVQRSGDEFAFLKNLGQGSQAAIGTMASAMLTFVGVVFSITLVALQMASNFTPRVIRVYVRSRITKLTFALCLATFIYTLRVQKEVLGGSSNDTGSDHVSSYLAATIAMTMVVACLVTFVFYVNNTIRMMRVTFVIAHVTAETNAVLDNYLRADTGGEHTAALPRQSAELVYQGKPGVLRDIHMAGLVRQATRADVAFRLLSRIGDPIITGQPLIAVHGSGKPGLMRWNRRTVKACCHGGQERSMAQDLNFGIRQLVDIASRALSPAVNDPTTAVQALDRIHVLMRRLAVTTPEDAAYLDRRQRVRLVIPVPNWTEMVDLAFTEIRVYGGPQPQVTRRMMAALDDLETAVADPEDAAPLQEQRRLLEIAVRASTADEAARAFALTADPQGIR